MVGTFARSTVKKEEPKTREPNQKWIKSRETKTKTRGLTFKPTKVERKET